ncbi:thermonuclease family protein [Nonomuraea sp. LPB2021202275-12-8]|uniref:thermonuclease family protein n=1 Tax=Nonomuraea sp. LPB2021202275-12-8 TaxID=3120159 RepID=UPI00300C8AC7
MAKALEQPVPGITVGHGLLARRNGTAEPVSKVVHDGDTINIAADGNLGVRLLGVDAPEVSFQLPRNPDFPDFPKGFARIGHPAWTTFLADPFAKGYAELPLRAALRAHLLTKLGPDAAANHAAHAAPATQALKDMIQGDITEQGHSDATFKLRLAFAYEILDRYGRMLCYVNREQRDRPRPDPYNERLLEAGHVVPYFIWPNVDPFVRQEGRVADAVPAPGTAGTIAEEGALGRARHAVQRARAAGLGLWDHAAPLAVLPFELRFLAQRRAPDRYVLDLSDTARELLHPQSYFRVPHPEDRLFVNAEHAPLFAQKGWSVPPL